MPVIVKLPSGNWRAQVRRKGKYISNTFRRRADADTWALETERTIDKGIDPTRCPYQGFGLRYNLAWAEWFNFAKQANGQTLALLGIEDRVALQEMDG